MFHWGEGLLSFSFQFNDQFKRAMSNEKDSFWDRHQNAHESWWNPVLRSGEMTQTWRGKYVGDDLVVALSGSESQPRIYALWVVCGSLFDLSVSVTSNAHYSLCEDTWTQNSGMCLGVRFVYDVIGWWLTGLPSLSLYTHWSQSQ